MSYYIRVWQAVDIEGVTKHLVIVGDITGDCASCRELGIEYAKVRVCPKCQTEFKFITVRSGPKGGAVKRIKDRRPDLTFIDYEDYQNITGKQKAKDFFK